MESLLRWGLENSTPADGQASPPIARKDIDPGIIDHILGKPDSVLMKEALEIAIDETKSERDRSTALDNLEMLIEQIDNANNITALKMWSPLMKLLSSPLQSIVLGTLWILGTAVQNNPPAQNAFLGYDPIPVLLSLFSSESSSPEIRSKVLYCLSGALKHNRDAVLKLEPAGGWQILRDALSDSNINVRRKIAFLFNTLLIDDGFVPDNPHVLQLSSTSQSTKDAIRQHDIISPVISSLVSPQPIGPDGDEVGIDLDYAEKAARILVTFAENGGGFSPSQKSQLRDALEDHARREEWGLGPKDCEILLESVQ